jgi:hypothetical protein
MTEGVKTIMYPVRDLANAKTLCGKLVGVEPYMDEVYYVGFNVGGQDIGLDPHGHSKGMTGPVAYWHVDDIEERLEALIDAGAEAHQESETSAGASCSLPSRTQTGTSSASFSHHSRTTDVVN